MASEITIDHNSRTHCARESMKTCLGLEDSNPLLEVSWAC